uniref:Fungal lipase-type domain-containing protein n=1 Tax=Globisporangium ultimum (strain ATCC 200006 / CBS 805.95 / DAOM BR144) TaxID=431595 RepID=K3WJS7_GLOUD
MLPGDDAKATPYHHAHTAEFPMLEDTHSLDARPHDLLSPEGPPLKPQQQQMPPPSASASARFFDHVDQNDQNMATTEGRLEELHAYYRSNSWLRIYRTLCQFRFGYFAFLVVMIIVMFSFTMLMEFFFAIFLPSARYDDYYIARSIGLVISIPPVLFFLSYFYEESTRLFTDAIDKTDGSLPNFRLALAVVIHYLRHRKEMQDPRAAERGSQDGEGNGESGGIAGLRNTILMTAKDDPFVDVDKEEEDLAWERQQELEEVAEREAAAAPLTAPQTTNAMNRWKRVKAAVTATLLIKKVEYEGPAIDISTFVIVDLICPVLFEIATMLALILEFLVSWSPTKAFTAYVQMGFWALSVYLVMWVVAHFWSSRNRKMRVLVSNYRRRRRMLRRAINELERHKRAEHLWLLDVGFRFYHHVGQRMNPMMWIKQRVDRNKNTKQTNDGATAGTTTILDHPYQSSSVQTDDVLIHVQDASRDEVAAAENEASSTKTPVTFAERLQNVREARARLRSRNPWYRLSYSKQAIILLVLVILSAIWSIWSFLTGWPIMGIFLIMLASVIQRRFPQIFGSGFRHFVKAFVFLSFVFFSSTFLIGTFVSGGTFKLGPFMNGTEAAVVLTKTTADSVSSSTLALGVPHAAEYPACTIDYDGLTVLDFALIADAAYGSTTETQKDALENRFNGTALGNWTYVARNNESTDHQVWMELYFAEINMTVIAVRGTASAADALEDLHYWFGITIMQAVNIFMPFLKQLPRAFVVNLLSMRLLTSIMPEPVYVPMLKHVREVRQRVGDNLVITGHSLGGAMAAVVGAKTKTRAVSFSGPGLLYSRGRFDVEASDIRDTVLTFKPRKDIVPRVDELGGMVQELRCKRNSPMQCHSSTTHICELYLSCGDERRRNWSVNKECIEYQALPPDDEDDS